METKFKGVPKITENLEQKKILADLALQKILNYRYKNKIPDCDEDNSKLIKNINHKEFADAL